MKRRKFLLFSSLICTCRTLVPESISESYSIDHVNALESRLLQVCTHFISDGFYFRRIPFLFFFLPSCEQTTDFKLENNYRKLLFHNFWRENAFGAPGRLVSHNRLHFHFIYLAPNWPKFPHFLVLWCFESLF